MREKCRCSWGSKERKQDGANEAGKANRVPILAGEIIRGMFRTDITEIWFAVFSSVIIEFCNFFFRPSENSFQKERYNIITFDSFIYVGIKVDDAEGEQLLARGKNEQQNRIKMQLAVFFFFF